MAEFVLRIPKQNVEAAGDGGFVLRMPAEDGAPAGRVTVGGEPSAAERVLASPGGRFLQGAKAPIDGAAELLPHALGNVTSLGGLAPNPVSEFLFDESRRVRQMNADGQRVMEQAKERTGNTGTDIAGMAGTVVGSMVPGLALPAAPVTTAGRAAYGAMMGGAGGALTPTAEVDDRKFAEEKAAQTTLGAVAGGVITPLAGKVIDKLGPMVDRWLARPGKAPMSESLIMERLRFELKKDDINLSQLSEDVQRRVVSEVADAMREGKSLDAAALARKLDLAQFGGGTKGQITRDPSQWVSEFDLRKIGGEASKPLLDQAQRVTEESRRRLTLAGAVKTDSPQDLAYQQGERVIKSLQGYDEPIKQAVMAAYKRAEQAGGVDARLKPWQFAELVEKVRVDGEASLNRLPKDIQDRVNEIARGELPFTVRVASDLQAELSDAARKAFRAGEGAQEQAINAVKSALKATDLDEAAGEPARRAFNEAKALAQARFKTRAAAPALEAAIKAAREPLKHPPEKFIEEHIIRGSHDAVRNLADIMPAEGREAVAKHLAQYLYDAGFKNAAKDGTMLTDKYNEAIKRIGRKKLGEFMPEDVVDDLFRISRVNTYVNVPPGYVPTDTGSAGAYAKHAGNLLAALGRIPGINIAFDVGRNVAIRGQVDRALSATDVLPEGAPVLTPALRNLLAPVPIGIGMTAAE